MVKNILGNAMNDFVVHFMEAPHHGRGHNLSRLVFKTAGELIKFRVMEKTQPIEAIHLTLWSPVSNHPANTFPLHPILLAGAATLVGSYSDRRTKEGYRVPKAQ